jgi:hypothetical protein
MKLSKTYERTRFSADVLREAVEFVLKAAGSGSMFDSQISHGNGSVWSYNNPAEFLSDYRYHERFSYLNILGGRSDSRLCSDLITPQWR